MNNYAQNRSDWQPSPDRITLFHEAPATNHRTLPMNLVPENHLWELSE